MEIEKKRYVQDVFLKGNQIVEEILATFLSRFNEEFKVYHYTFEEDLVRNLFNKSYNVFIKQLKESNSDKDNMAKEGVTEIDNKVLIDKLYGVMKNKLYVDGILNNINAIVEEMVNCFLPRFHNSFKKYQLNNDKIDELFFGVYPDVAESLNRDRNHEGKVFNLYYTIMKRTLSRQNRKNKNHSRINIDEIEDKLLEDEYAEAPDFDIEALLRHDCFSRLSDACRKIISDINRNKTSNAERAVKLGYKDESSYNTQKYRCINYLRNCMKNNLIHV